jgi:hypothetical protein
MTRPELMARINELQEYDQLYVEQMKKAWGSDLERAEGRLMADILSYLLGRRLTQHTRTKAGA